MLSPHSVHTSLRVSASILTSYWFLLFEMSCPPQLIVNDKSQNLRRLQAQRNELNAKGERGRRQGCMWAVGLRSDCLDLPESSLHIGAFVFSVQGDVHMCISLPTPPM